MFIEIAGAEGTTIINSEYVVKAVFAKDWKSAVIHVTDCVQPRELIQVSRDLVDLLLQALRGQARS
jgi:hypothetical protein